MIRVIPCLDVDRGRVVKGVNFVGLRDAGDPVELAARYDREGADELVFLDITASHEGRGTIVSLIPSGDQAAAGHWMNASWLTGCCLKGMGSLLPAGVTILANTVPSMVLLMKRTEPSQKA